MVRSIFLVSSNSLFKVQISHLSDCNWTRTHNYLVHKRTLNHLAKLVNGWVFVYELSGCRFESSCSHLNLRFRACFEQRVPWHSGNYSVWIHSDTRTRHDKNIQSISHLLFITIGLLYLITVLRCWLHYNGCFPMSFRKYFRMTSLETLVGKCPEMNFENSSRKAVKKFIFSDVAFQQLPHQLDK